MAKAKAKRRNAKTAHKNKKQSPSLVGLFFAAVGKPFYFVLSRIFIVFATLLYLISKLVSKLKSKKQKRETAKKNKKTKSKFKFPNLEELVKLKLLRLRLLILQKISLLKFPRVNLKKKRWIIVLCFFILVASFYFLIFKGLPSPRELTKRQIDVSTKIYDRNGTLLYKIYKDKNRTIVPLSKIPNHVILATLASEDAEFYVHPGFSIRGIFRAFTQNLSSGKLQGGSTITQQLVKNALLTPERTLTRKIKELILAVEVELTYSKDEILEMYLNEVSYGGTSYGIEEASQNYFGKSVTELNLAEAAFLAGLPQSPTKLSPFGQNPELIFNKQKEVIRLMKVNKFIDVEDEEKALNQKITLVANRKEIKAPHFVMYIREQLVNEYGEEAVETGGLEVTTTLDLSIQEMAQNIVTEEVAKIKRLNVGNGAAIILDPKSGEILGMVGSIDYFDIKNDGNVNVTTRLRQPGSSIKIVNYAYAFLHNYSPSSTVDDSPVSFSVPGSPTYSPKNYDGKFKGKVTLRTALAESRNIPAVKLLASYGVSKMVDLGKKMGITTWEDSSRFGLSLTLGGGETKLIDLATVYATVANEGVKPSVKSIIKVTNYQGKDLTRDDKPTLFEQVLDKRVAYILIDILKDNIARSGEFGLNSSLVIKNHPEVAVKTGTSNDLRDNLAIGFNQNYLVATWVGNNDNSPMSRIASGITGASPIWNRIMTNLLSESPSIDWQVPTGIVKAFDCVAGKADWFLEENKPTKACKPLPSVSPTPFPRVLGTDTKKEVRKVER